MHSRQCHKLVAHQFCSKHSDKSNGWKDWIWVGIDLESSTLRCWTSTMISCSCKSSIFHSISLTLSVTCGSWLLLRASMWSILLVTPSLKPQEAHLIMQVSSSNCRRTCRPWLSTTSTWSMIKATQSATNIKPVTGHTPTPSSSCQERFKRKSKVIIWAQKLCARESRYKSQTLDQTPT